MKLQEIEALFSEYCQLYPENIANFIEIHFRKLLDIAWAAKAVISENDSLNLLKERLEFLESDAVYHDRPYDEQKHLDS